MATLRILKAYSADKKTRALKDAAKLSTQTDKNQLNERINLLIDRLF